MKSQKRWWVNPLVALVSFFAALALAEAAVRWFAPQPPGLSLQDRYGLTMHYPGIKTYLPQYRVEVSFNRAGMRDREHAEDRPADGFRILLLGDSFMEALQVPFDASLPSHLERTLTDRSGKPVEVINASVGGWGTDDQLRYLTRYGLKYHPDLVMAAMTLHNDISDNLRQRWHTLENGSLIEKPVVAMSEMRYLMARLKAFASARFQLYQLYRRVSQNEKIRRTGAALDAHVAQLFRDPTPNEIARGFLLTERLLAAVRDSATAAGASVVLVLLPIKLQLAPSDFADFMRQSGGPDQEMDIGRPQRVLGEITGRLGIPVIDLLAPFRQWSAENDASLYGDHWNNAGHRLAAEVVAEAIIRSGMLR